MGNFKLDNAGKYYVIDTTGTKYGPYDTIPFDNSGTPEYECQEDSDSDYDNIADIPGYNKTFVSDQSNNKLDCDGYDYDADGVYLYTRNDSAESHWDPLISEISTNGYTNDNVQKVVDCCSNSLTSIADKEACGSLYYDGTGSKPPQCASLLKKWCKNVKNMNDDKCYDTVSSDPGYFNLKTVCAKKKPGDGWDKICACHYPTKFYTDIATEIADVWNAPVNLIETKPECIYPQCKVAGTRDKRAKCSPTSFTQCIQETNVDLTDSNVRDVKIDQSKLQCGQYNKIKPVKYNGPSGSGVNQSTTFGTTPPGTTPPPAGTTPPPAGTPPPKKDVDKKKIIAIILIVVLIVGAIITAIAMSGGKKPVQQAQFQQAQPRQFAQQPQQFAQAQPQ